MSLITPATSPPGAPLGVTGGATAPRSAELPGPDAGSAPALAREMAAIVDGAGLAGRVTVTVRGTRYRVACSGASRTPVGQRQGAAAHLWAGGHALSAAACPAQPDDAHEVTLQRFAQDAGRIAERLAEEMARTVGLTPPMRIPVLRTVAVACSRVARALVAYRCSLITVSVPTVAAVAPLVLAGLSPAGAVLASVTLPVAAALFGRNLIDVVRDDSRRNRQETERRSQIRAAIRRAVTDMERLSRTLARPTAPCTDSPQAALIVASC